MPKKPGTIIATAQSCALSPRALIDPEYANTSSASGPEAVLNSSADAVDKSANTIQRRSIPMIMTRVCAVGHLLAPRLPPGT